MAAQWQPNKHEGKAWIVYGKGNVWRVIAQSHQGFNSLGFNQDELKENEAFPYTTGGILERVLQRSLKKIDESEGQPFLTTLLLWHIWHDLSRFINTQLT